MTVDFTGMEPAVENIVIYKGSTFDSEYEILQEDKITPYDLTGCSVQLLAKNAAGETVEDWTDVNGKMSLSSLGIMAFHVTDEYSAAITWTEILTYCIWITDTLGQKYQFFEGRMSLSDNCG